MRSSFWALVFVVFACYFQLDVHFWILFLFLVRHFSWVCFGSCSFLCMGLYLLVVNFWALFMDHSRLFIFDGVSLSRRAFCLDPFVACCYSFLFVVSDIILFIYFSPLFIWPSFSYSFLQRCFLFTRISFSITLNDFRLRLSITGFLLYLFHFRWVFLSGFCIV